MGEIRRYLITTQDEESYGMLSDFQISASRQSGWNTDDTCAVSPLFGVIPTDTL